MNTSNRPKILVTNDDGIFAPGIFALSQAMEAVGEVYVVAPDAERSAVGHAITLSDPLRVWEFEKNGSFFGWAVNGTPADCVKLAVKALLDFKPDLVVSGINLGPNTAMNVIYSGTVSAATEGTILGIPSIAFSLSTFRKTDFSFAQKVARQVARQVLQNGLPEDTLLNVNIPALPESEIKGIKITRQGKGRYEEILEKRVDPMKRTYYWLGGKKLILDTDEDVDEVAVMNGYVSITPLHYDLTDYRFLKQLKTWDLE
ncbi:MAG: 5'/3'-nucleotidase SurE [Calditrichaeota bacterium]|nr:MAG: 5'/3'-nucleotidase SurE [Calditrichota bacterium]